MWTPLTFFKKQSLEKRRGLLYKQYEAANSQLDAELNAANRVLIETQIQDLEREIQQVETESEQLGSAPEAPADGKTRKIPPKQIRLAVTFLLMVVPLGILAAHYWPQPEPDETGKAREEPPAKNGQPIPYDGPDDAKEDYFVPASDFHPNRDRWDYPADQWELVKDPYPTDDGALLLKGPTPGVLRTYEGKAFYNFTVEFPIRFISGATSVAWALRVQPDKQSGYFFELTKSENTLYLSGEVRQGNQHQKVWGATLGITGPFYNEDVFIIEARVKDHDLRYCITLNSNRRRDENDQPREWLGKPVHPVFTDREAHFRFGSVGLIGPKDGRVLVEQFRIWPFCPETMCTCTN